MEKIKQYVQDTANSVSEHILTIAHNMSKMLEIEVKEIETLSYHTGYVAHVSGQKQNVSPPDLLLYVAPLETANTSLSPLLSVEHSQETQRLRVATTIRQGISVWASRTVSGMWVAASPISSRLRSVAS